MQPQWRPPSPEQPFYGHGPTRALNSRSAILQLAPAQGLPKVDPFPPAFAPVAGPSRYNPALDPVPTKRAREDTGGEGGHEKEGPRSEKVSSAAQMSHLR